MGKTYTISEDLLCKIVDALMLADQIFHEEDIVDDEWNAAYAYLETNIEEVFEKQK